MLLKINPLIFEACVNTFMKQVQEVSDDYLAMQDCLKQEVYTDNLINYQKCIRRYPKYIIYSYWLLNISEYNQYVSVHCFRQYH